MSKLSFVIGGAAWAASEYFIHRFVGHGPKRTQLPGLAKLTPAGLAAEFNAEHLAHHATPTYFAPTWRKLLAAGAVVPAATALMTPVLGLRRAASFALGFTTVYFTYEVVHRRIHTHAPTGPYSRWVRRHHLLHHHKTPKKNHGVTSAVFDRLMGTFEPREQVKIPRHVAPRWMLDERGEVRLDVAADYALVGRPAASHPRPTAS